MRRLLVVLLVLSAPGAAVAQVPKLLGYQGRVVLPNGSPATGAHALGFEFYAAESGGTPLSSWTESQTIALSDGYYAVFIGQKTALPAGLFDGQDRWLEVSIDGVRLSPRSRIASVAYALMATDLSGGTVNASTISVAGNQVFNAQGQLQPSAATAFAVKTQLSAAGTVNTATNPIDWTQLKNVPASIADGSDDSVPPGTLVAFGGDVAPAGWALCNGGALSRTTNAALFAVVGIKFGAGDGSTTFNLPNLSRRFPMGRSAAEVVGATGGQFDHSHGLASHAHVVDPPPTDGDDGHNWQANNCNNGGGKDCEGHVHTTDIPGFSSAGGVVGLPDGGVANFNSTLSANPPYVAVNYLIKL